MLEDMPTSCQTCVEITEINGATQAKTEKKSTPAILYSVDGPLPKANIIIKTDPAVMLL